MSLPLVPLGNSELRVTPICLGTMTFGEQVSEADSHAILDRSLERGVNFIDTAEMYSVPAKAETCGSTETILGNWFAKHPSVRQKLVLATKVAGLPLWLPARVFAAHWGVWQTSYPKWFRSNHRSQLWQGLNTSQPCL